jgi:hypothetical protein
MYHGDRLSIVRRLLFVILAASDQLSAISPQRIHLTNDWDFLCRMLIAGNS